MVRKLQKDIIGFGQGALSLTLGATVTGQAVRQSGVSGLGPLQSSFPLIARFTPIAAVGIGGSAALRSVGKLKKKKKKGGYLGY